MNSKNTNSIHHGKLLSSTDYPRMFGQILMIIANVFPNQIKEILASEENPYVFNYDTFTRKPNGKIEVENAMSAYKFTFLLDDLYEMYRDGNIMYDYDALGTLFSPKILPLLYKYGLKENKISEAVRKAIH